MRLFLDMLAHKRPSGSESVQVFCDKYLRPVFGEPDDHGNYSLSIGDAPRVIFTAHHDTVHAKGGRQNLLISGDTVTSDADCLGADCTTGVFIILEMIAAQVPGLYVIHADEEIGLVGSKAFVEDDWGYLAQFDACISFDRFGTESIVTHQMGARTCSDEFAASLESILGLGLSPDQTGSYTDSKAYQYCVAECTNISVGYYNQHSSKESQDMLYLRRLVRALIAADWDSVVVKRNKEAVEYLDKPNYYWDNPAHIKTDSNMVAIVEEYPELIAELLEQFGYDSHALLDELNIDPAATWRFN